MATDRSPLASPCPETSTPTMFSHRTTIDGADLGPLPGLGMLCPTMPESSEPAAPNATLSDSLMSAGQSARERIFSFWVTYAGIFLFIVLYLATIRVVERTLEDHFQVLAEAAVDISHLDRPIATQIQEAIERDITGSDWVRYGGVRVTTLVLANDGLTWIYVDGFVVPQPEGLRPTDVLREAINLLPATVNITLSVPHNALLSNAILIAYAAVLLQCLYLYNRHVSRGVSERLVEARRMREEAAQRSTRIGSELAATRQRLAALEPAEREHTEEIRRLYTERRSLQLKMSELAAREEELRGKAEQAVELSQEVTALEDLLEEASGDLATKDEEIGDLQKNLKTAARAAPTGGKRARGTESLAKRFRTLYPTLEVDDRAISDLVALRDESMKLKAEEQLKRLSEEADNVAVRRKVGGLPGYLTIFELGFAGKGRLYYTKGRQQRFRVLAVGAKNTQDDDMEFLRRLPRPDTV